MRPILQDVMLNVFEHRMMNRSKLSAGRPIRITNAVLYTEITLTNLCEVDS